MKKLRMILALGAVAATCSGCSVGSGVCAYALEAHHLSPVGEERLLDKSFSQMHGWVENRLEHEKKREAQRRAKNWEEYILNLEMQDLEEI